MKKDKKLKKEKKLCCGSMTYHVNYRCDMHPNPLDCPDNVIIYYKRSNTYGIPIRDGENGSAGSAYIRIKCCPWCGTKLPKPKPFKPPK